MGIDMFGWDMCLLRDRNMIILDGNNNKYTPHQCHSNRQAIDAFV